MDTKNLTAAIKFGIANPSIASQLRKQKVKFNSKEIGKFDRLSTCIHSLRLNGIITDKQSLYAFHRLGKQIFSHVRKIK